MVRLRSKPCRGEDPTGPVPRWEDSHGVAERQPRAGRPAAGECGVKDQVSRTQPTTHGTRRIDRGSVLRPAPAGSVHPLVVVRSRRAWRLHFSEQYLTSSKTFFHLALHSNGRPQTSQILGGIPFFVLAMRGVFGTPSILAAFTAGRDDREEEPRSHGGSHRTEIPFAAAFMAAPSPLSTLGASWGGRAATAALRCRISAGRLE